jgi:tetratricopeptide (TPR) repeat protein
MIVVGRSHIAHRESVLFGIFAMAYQFFTRWLRCSARNLRSTGAPSRAASIALVAAGLSIAGCMSPKPGDANYGQQPTGLAALSPSAIGQSVSKSFKAGSDKVSQALKPKPEPQEVAKRDSGGGFWPFKKKDPPPTPEFFVALARVQEQTGEQEMAAAQYEKALALDKNHLDALVGYAHMLDDQGHKVKATEYYLRAVKAHPDDASAANDLGLCYARQGKLDLAIEYLSKAVTLQPDRELYRNNIATVLVQIGRSDEAVRQIAAVYGDPIAHYNVGVLLQHQGKRELAIREFTMAAQQDPGMNEAREWLDRLNADMGPREQLASAQIVDDESTESSVRPAVQAQRMEGDNEEGSSSRRARVASRTTANVVRQNAYVSPKADAPAVANDPTPAATPAATTPAAVTPATAAQSLPAPQSTYMPPSRY